MEGMGRPRKVRTKVCPQCGVEHSPKDWRTIYCSRRCSKLKDLPTKTCERCGVEFRKSNEWSYAVWETIRFCSTACRGNGRPQTILECATCGERFAKRQYHYPSRLFYCSRACYWISQRTERYPVRDRRLGQEFSRATRRRLIERAGGECESCGAAEHLEFDHIVPCHLEGTNEESNGQVLCRECHRQKTTAEIRAANALRH